MRFVIPALLPASAILLVACAHAPAKPPPSVIPLLESAKADEAAIKDCEQHCVPADAAMASALDSMMQLRKMAAGGLKVEPKDTRESQKNLLTAVASWFDANKDSPDPPRALAAFQYASTLMPMAEMMDPALAASMNEKLKAAAPALPTRFPQEPRAFLFHARLLGTQQPLEMVIGDFKHCLALDPQEKRCRRAYEMATEDYLEPYCPGESVSPRLGFYLSVPQRDTSHPLALRFAKKDIFLEKEPRLTAQDVALAKTAHLRGSAKDTHDEVMLEFNPVGTQKFAELTAANVGSSLAVVLGKRVLLNARILNRIPGGRVMVTMGRDAEPTHGAHKLIGDLCAKVVTRELPPELKMDLPSSP